MSASTDAEEIARLKAALLECYQTTLASAHEYTDDWTDRRGEPRLNGTTGWPSVICGDVGAIVAHALYRDQMKTDYERGWNEITLRRVRKSIAALLARVRVPETP